MSLKEKLKNLIEPILLILVLFDVVLLIITTLFDLPANIGENIIIFDLFVCFLLILEFLYNIMKTNDKKQYLKEHWFELVSSIPIDFFLLRMLRFTRVFRLIRLARILSLSGTDVHLLKHYIEKSNLSRLMLIIIFIVCFTTVILFIIEPGMDDLLTSFWYVLVTVTSVGYGDVTPVTPAGKFVGIFLIIIGFIVLSIFIGIISKIYEDRLYRDEILVKEKEEKKVRENINEILELSKKQSQEINALKQTIDEQNVKISKLENELMK